MRIALYDEIIETHVPRSLGAALLQRGHEVFSTGKIGHGFKYPDSVASGDLLRASVRRVLSWEPDWIFVFRPASLPDYLIAEVKSAGVKLAAWFSDDPVLFELSYGPNLELYDLVLHCGNSSVLDFYEQQFGYATGVNFPFWTSNDHFPYVWGSEDVESDFLFLGNVGDAVRRRRYFEIARLKSSVRIHGGVGADYFNLAGGYLDSDAEVVNAGARSRLALNIPQFFKDHDGLETWFDGLGELGFFEYPSRVVQYMAMGLPTVSVIPGAPTFGSFPEMLIAGSVSEVNEMVADLGSDELSDLSRATRTRFERDFSAQRRAEQFEYLTSNNEWKGLDAVDRANWFTEWPKVDRATLPAGREMVIGTARLSRVPPTEAVHEVRDPTRETNPSPSKLLIVGTGWTRPLSHVNTLSRASLRIPDLSATLWNPAHESGFVEDPNKIFKWMFSANRVEEISKSYDVVVVADYSAVFSGPAAKALRDSDVRTVFWAESDWPWDRRIALAAQRYSEVWCGSPAVVDEAYARGFSNVRLVHGLIDQESLEILRTKSVEALPVEEIKWFSANPKADDSFSALRLNDLVSSPAVDLPAFARASGGKSLTEVLEGLRCTTAVVSHAGSRARPRVAEYLPFILAASDELYLVRAGSARSMAPYSDSVLQVREVGELARKRRRLKNSKSLRSFVALGKDRLLTGMLSAESEIERLLAESRWAELEEVEDSSTRLAPDRTTLWTGKARASALVRDKMAVPSGQSVMFEIRMDPPPAPGLTSSMTLDLGGESVLKCQSGDPVYVVMRSPRMENLSVTASWSGLPGLLHPDLLGAWSLRLVGPPPIVSLLGEASNEWLVEVAGYEGQGSSGRGHNG